MGLRLRREAALRAERLRKQKMKKTVIAASVAMAVAIAAFLVNDKIIQPPHKYAEAKSLMNDQHYLQAYAIFEKIRGYKGADELIKKPLRIILLMIRNESVCQLLMPYSRENLKVMIMERACSG